MADIEKILNSLSLEQMCGQVLAYDIQPRDVKAEAVDIIKKMQPGSLFMCARPNVTSHTMQRKDWLNKDLQRIATESAGIPCINCTDVEYGPGSFHSNLPELPNPMAWAACGDEKLVERAGELTGRIMRKCGIQFMLGPMVDLVVNFRNPLVVPRAVSDDPEQVIKMAGAYIRGAQKNGYLMGCLKHFPGDGVDERNQHFMTTENSLSKEEWMATYGKVYRELIKQGVAGIMAAHISLPAFQEGEIDEFGALPATLSKKLMTDLLKGELGFEGCVISDAMSMIGTISRVPEEKLAIEFLKAGGDLILFPLPEEKERIINAVKSGELPLERLKDAVRRVLRLKDRARLFDDVSIDAEIGNVWRDMEELNRIAEKISDGAVEIVRNYDRVLPVKKSQGKVLIIKMSGSFFRKSDFINSAFTYIEKEFRDRGWEVNSSFNFKHNQIEKIIGDYDLVLVPALGNVHGATLRVNWDMIMPLWRGYFLRNKNVVFIGLDDPFKLYDFPYAKTYINTYGTSGCLQKSLVKVILGEIPSIGKCPVNFPPYLKREIK
ncbi:MAG: hypothetical protein IJ800_03835 [Clostridia bacterium]|nr:hypothetical protein [Clostridia bacterium]